MARDKLEKRIKRLEHTIEAIALSLLTMMFWGFYAVSQIEAFRYGTIAMLILLAVWYVVILIKQRKADKISQSEAK